MRPAANASSNCAHCKAGKQDACQEARRYGHAQGAGNVRLWLHAELPPRDITTAVTPAGHPPLLRCQDKIPQHIQGMGKQAGIQNELIFYV